MKGASMYVATVSMRNIHTYTHTYVCTIDLIHLRTMYVSHLGLLTKD